MFQGDCTSIQKGFTDLISGCVANKKGCARIRTLLAGQKGTGLGILQSATRTPPFDTLLYTPGEH